jgi:hypothetical protein
MFSQAEMLAAVDAVAGRLLAGTTAQVVSAAPRVNGSGIDVEALDTSLTRSMLSTGAAGPGSVIAAAAGQLAGDVPVSVTVVADAPLTAARAGDTNPFYGGATMRNVGNQLLCTTGWRMKTPTGGSRMVTAFHCNSMSTTYHNFNTYNELGGIGAGLTIGKGTNGFKTYDFMFITPASGASFWSSIYDGAWNSGSSDTVTGLENAVVGAPICLSGGFSGVICGQPVRAVNVTITYAAPVGSIGNLVKTVDPNGVAAAGTQDSGSPTYVTAATGVHVISMIQGIAGTRLPCRGAPGNPSGRECTATVYSVPATLIRSKSGYTL